MRVNVVKKPQEGKNRLEFVEDSSALLACSTKSLGTCPGHSSGISVTPQTPLTGLMSDLYYSKAA